VIQTQQQQLPLRVLALNAHSWRLMRLAFHIIKKSPGFVKTQSQVLHIHGEP